MPRRRSGWGFRTRRRRRAQDVCGNRCARSGYTFSLNGDILSAGDSINRDYCSVKTGIEQIVVGVDRVEDRRVFTRAATIRYYSA